MTEQITRLTNELILDIQNLNFQIKGKTILKNLNFSLPAGSFCCILGDSGCGKTSLLKIISGLTNPQSGKLYINNRLMMKNGQSIIPVEQRRIGLVFQDYGLFPHLNIRENILFGLPKCSQLQQNEVVNRLLKLVKLQGCENYFPNELSGGQQQRIALARTIAPDPLLVLLDEPFSNIDQTQRFQLAHEIKAILKKNAVPALMVTHDQEEALMLADYIGIIAENQLIQWDTPENLYFKPKHTKVAEYIGLGNWYQTQLIEQNKLLTPFGILNLTEQYSQNLQKIREKPCKIGEKFKLYLRDENFKTILEKQKSNPFESLQENQFPSIPFIKRWQITAKRFSGTLTYLELTSQTNSNNNHPALKIETFIRSSQKTVIGQSIQIQLNIDNPILFPLNNE